MIINIYECIMFVVFFFFKQKTAYEIRISDWSSDVCSSDLALQTGVMDGQENPYTQIWSAKFQEVQKYLSITGHVYTPAYALVSEQHYAALPEDVRSVLDRCGQETQGFVYEKIGRANV